MPIILMVLGIYTLLAPLIIYNEIKRKKDDEKMASFMRYAHMESQKISKENQRILDEARQTNKDNALFLRMIFERVDKPEENKS